MPTEDPSQLTFQFMTRPTNNGDALMSFPKYRGTKTAAEVYAETSARLTAANLPVTVENVFRVGFEVILDWTIATWKIDPLGDDAIAFLCASGGSIPLGQPEDWNFDTTEVELRGHWGEGGRQRARERFHAEKVGQQNRVAPVFAAVYDSASKTPNHYVAGGDVTIKLGNRGPRFDLGAGCGARVRTADGVWHPIVDFPYYKGQIIVIRIPAGITGSIELELTAIINSGLKTGTYGFPLT